MKKQSAFTFIEILVVLVIMSIVASMAVLGMSGWVAQKRLQNQAEKCTIIFQHAEQAAILTPDTIALEIHSHAYQFYRWQKGADKPHWQLIQNEKTFQKSVLTHGMQFRLDNLPEKNRIIFDSNGEVTPFQLMLQDSNGKTRFIIEGKSNGQISQRSVDS